MQYSSHVKICILPELLYVINGMYNECIDMKGFYSHRAGRGGGGGVEWLCPINVNTSDIRDTSPRNWGLNGLMVIQATGRRCGNFYLVRDNKYKLFSCVD